MIIGIFYRKKRLNYVVQIINPKRKGDVTTRTLHEEFIFPSDLKENLVDTFSEQVPDGEKFSIGYFEKPGNSKRCIESAENMKAMYKTYRYESTINILCDGQMEGAPEVSRAKRGNSGDSTPCSKRVKRKEEIDSFLSGFVTDIVRTIATLSL